MRFLLALAVLLTTTTAAAADDDRWARLPPLRTRDYVLVPVLGATMLTTGLVAGGSREPRWTGRNGFDDGIRDALRAGTAGQRSFAGVTSDVTWIGMTLYPPIVESLVLAGLVHHKWDVAFRLFMVYGEAGLSAGVATVLSQGLVHRARPLTEECARDGGYDPMCGTKQLSRSFFAGHAAASFNSAALACVNGSKLPLYGSRAGAIAACAGTMTLATTTALLRIVADKHWASDVLAGSAAGLATGLLIPLLLHYAHEPTSAWTVSPVVNADVRGFALARSL